MLKIFDDLFCWYIPTKSIEMVSVYYHELVRQILKYDWKKYLITDDKILNQLLVKVGKLTNEILIGAGHKLPYYFNLK